MDETFLRELAGGDRQLMREILDDFAASDTVDRRNLAAAIAAKDARAIETHAHRIKGAARAIGATAYADAAQGLERAAPTGADLAALVEALEKAAEDVSKWAPSLA